MRRTLSAVLAADVVGYSNLMGKDADGTLAILRRIRKEIFDPLVSSKHGKIVKSMGDGWIVTFAAVSEAVECAMQIQDRLKIDGMLQLRMGLHIGDVAEADNDVFGEGINVAARLEALAEPGALAISGAVRTLLDGTLRPSFEEAGERSLKNISEPVPVWVRGGEVAGGKTAMESKGLPSLAILPVSTPDPRYEITELAKAITGDLATHLNALRFLKSRPTQSPDNFEYRLSATLRARGNRLRLEATLAAPGGAQVLAEKFDGDLENSFDWQDETGLTLAQHVLDRLISHEVASFEHLENQKCSAEQLLLRMLALSALDGPGVGLQVDLMNLAIDRKPDWGPSYAYAIGWWALASSNGLGRYVAHHRDKLSKWNAKVEELEPSFSNARIVFALGKVVQFGDYAGAVADMRMVLRNLPFDPEALSWAAWVYNYCDRPHDALNCIEQVERSVLPTYLAPAVINSRAMVHMLLGEYETAVFHATRASEMSPSFIGAYLIAAASFALSGNKNAAAKAMEKVITLSPNYTLTKAGWRGNREFPPGIVRYFEGLKMAGLPE